MRTRDPLISRLKIMAKLDISEKRLPQDGRIKIRLRVEERSRDLDLRVSTVPAQFGEKVVMRLLDKTKLQLDMTQLGFEAEPLRRFKDAIDRPYGIVLVTGPTGSGKTNTLYSAIAALNEPDGQHHDGRGPDRVQPRRHQPGPDEGADRADVRLGAALLPAPGPRHHPRRRDPRLRDGRDRGQGGADRPPGALDAPHQRRALDDQPPHEHGHRAVPRRDLDQRDLRPASRPAHLRQLRGRGRDAAPDAHPGRVRPRRGQDPEDQARPGLRPLRNSAATRAAAASTRSSSSPTRSGT